MRVDKTESAIGVTRGTLAADIAQADWNQVIGVGVNAAGLIVKGAGQSGVIGVLLVDKTNYKAGTRCDIFGNGSEVVGNDQTVPFVAGTKYYATSAGVVNTTLASNTYIGFTLEATRLVVVI